MRTLARSRRGRDVRPAGRARAPRAALALVLLVLSAWACKNDSGPDLNAYRMTPVSGDSQTAPAGSRLADARVRVTLGGQAQWSMAVVWSAYGGATADTTISRTDVEGVASMGWKLGATPGPQYLTASVPWSLNATYTFRATALPAAGDRVPAAPQPPAGTSSAASGRSATGRVK